MNTYKQVVSDTGPLITLEKLSNGYSFIRKLYSQIFIPSTVLDELFQGQFSSPEAYVAHYDVADLLKIVEVIRSSRWVEKDPWERGHLGRSVRDAHTPWEIRHLSRF